MPIDMQESSPRTDERKRIGKRTDEIVHYPWGYLLLAMGPIALALYYVILEAPSLVPLPAGVEVPFPLITGYLEDACIWSGKNQLAVMLIGAGLLVPGVVFRYAATRYFVFLTVVVSLALGFTYYSISAPVERLLKNVKDNVPERHLPDYLPGKSSR